MIDKDKMTLDLTDNEALAECFSKKAVGETLSLTLDGKYKMEAKIDDIDPGKLAVLSLVTEEAEESTEKKDKPKEPVDLVMEKATDAPEVED